MTTPPSSRAAEPEILPFMTAIWMEGDAGVWSLQPAAGYENEQSLHDIVMRTPELGWEVSRPWKAEKSGSSEPT